VTETRNDSSIVQLDRRTGQQRRQEGSERRQGSISVAEERRNGDRRKSQRRRQIDPTTCERDYTADEIEFMRALDDYKRSSGRMFPTCSEILEVVRSLGYARPHDEGSSIESEDSAESDLLQEEPETAGMLECQEA
jgi:hypothetical protein